MINEYGGKMPDAVGIPEEQLRKAARMAVCKINIDSDLRLAMTGTIRKFLAEHPDKFDPREYLKPARAAIKELVAHKIVDVLGCDFNSAPEPAPDPVFEKKAEGARCAPSVFLSGVSYCLSEAAISASRSSTRRAKAAMVQSSTVSPGRITRLKKQLGISALAQLFLNAQVAPLAMVGGMAAAGGVLAGAEMRHGSSPFSIG